ncbi:hypothetical protein Acsp04_66150 [Actinomadura sp. NBRC 104425]|uniref:DUF397 domain-containing protein n=1 Tax=Actinomadura sp. NBRC 104425 TaxID=3032204 RepID=UPI0024A0FCAE|nr:DUF397 domain-containing protein [Actinomadura sp. NBRC 104425]GLZ16380.1 hypothetical protein Acsp04_66150 [Actinomadura sp. NBRC 104425]
MIVWRKSSRSASSGATDCVELADLGLKVGIRDSKDPDGAQLQLLRGDLRKLVSAGKAGKLDL